MRYAVSDLHGQYDMFIQLLELIKFSNNDTMYIIGDIIDRGSDSIKLLKYVMANKNIIMAKGNHEEMFEAEYNGKEPIGVWGCNGGKTTYAEIKYESSETILKFKEYISNLPLYLDLGDYLLVHAGILVPFDETNRTWENVKNYQDSDDLLWVREKFYNRKALSDRVIVFGHTPTKYINLYCNKRIWFDKIHKDKIGIDCGLSSMNNRVLGCINLDTREEYYIKE